MMDREENIQRKTARWCLDVDYRIKDNEYEVQ